MAGEISETPSVGVGRLLMDDRFLVPNHQRDYSWTEDEIKQLFDDIENALKVPNEPYFLGLMVFLHSSNDILKVLDGQQRLATITIFFAAIRNWLSQYTQYQGDAAKIQDRFIGPTELGQKHPLPRLTLNSANSGVFGSHVVDSVAISDTRKLLASTTRYDRNRRLIECTVYCHNRVADIAKRFATPDEAAAYLFQLVEYVRDYVRVVRLTVSSESTAYMIFETLNDRGLELSPLDLVKNYMLSIVSIKAPLRLSELDGRWAQMMSTLMNVKADAFLKVFWTSRHGRIQTLNLFDEFKKNYANANDVIALSIEMLIAAEQFAALESSNDPVWAKCQDQTKQIIDNLRLLGGRQMAPVILSALVKWDLKQFERLLVLLEAVLVRYQLIGGGRTGALEIACANLARGIYKGDVKTATEAATSLKAVYLSDDAFRQAFADAQEDNNQKAQYILRKLETEERRRALGNMAKEHELGSLTVEHILPRNGGAEWADVIAADPGLVDECAYRIGNLCLLTEVNSQLGDKSFAKKKPVFA